MGAPAAVAGTAAADATDALPAPAEFLALTVNVYEVPFVRPTTVQEVVEVMQVNEPGLDVTVYPVRAAPPFDAGAVHDTIDCVLTFDVAVIPVGAPGVVAGIAPAEATDATPEPAEFVAVTVNVYEVPFVRPTTVQVVVGAVALQVNDPGEDVTV